MAESCLILLLGFLQLVDLFILFVDRFLALLPQRGHLRVTLSLHIFQLALQFPQLRLPLVAHVRLATYSFKFSITGNNENSNRRNLIHFSSAFPK